jgi:hypothetical protein
MKVQKKITPILMMGVIVWCLMACEKMTLPEHEGEANSSLQVCTRIGEGNEGAVINYPVYVYVFKGEDCVALQTISSESQMLNIALTEGTYSVYAIGGASEENYVLPTQETATPSMAITLKEGKSHGDLMMAKSNVTLVDGGTNTLTLGMERKIMELKSVVLNNIPSAATAVSVTISPLWQQLEGITYAEQEGEATIALTKQENERTWTLANTQYLLPPSGNTLTIAVNIVTPNGTKTYTYNSTEALESAGKLNIQGTYTEAVGVTLTGTITGATWKSEKTISFEFNESGSQTADTNTGNDSGNDNNTGNENNNNDIITGTIPTVGSTYQTCYVLAVTDKGSYSEVLLLSPNQKVIDLTSTGITASEAMNLAQAAIPECSVSGINDWRLMTKAEAEIIRKDHYVPNISNSKYLYINADNKLRIGEFGSTQVSEGWTFKNEAILRPVTTIKMKASE